MDGTLSRTNYLPYVALIIALVATLGSLSFSELLHLPPCVLCWYQRILMYPLVVILVVSILRRDRASAAYVLPLSLLGVVVAMYHNLLYYHILPESISPCQVGISCTTRQIEWLGFITIPLLSLIAFSAITISMFAYYSSLKTYEPRS